MAGCAFVTKVSFLQRQIQLNSARLYIDMKMYCYINSEGEVAIKNLDGYALYEGHVDYDEFDRIGMTECERENFGNLVESLESGIHISHRHSSTNFSNWGVYTLYDSDLRNYLVFELHKGNVIEIVLKFPITEAC